MVWHREEILRHDLILDCSHTRLVAEEIFCYYPKHRHKLLNVLNGVTVPRMPYNIVVGSHMWQGLMEGGITQFADTPWQGMYGALQAPLRDNEILGFIHWACDTEFYCPSDYGKEDYFLWMARPSPYKGLHRALQLAVDHGFPLKIVMPVKMAEHAFFSGTYTEPISIAQRQNPRIEIVHLPENSQHHILKRELYRKARALLVPYEAHEPFGLVLIEALACGTPVIASRMGAFPEIIKEGETGFLCTSPGEYSEAIESLDSIAPLSCRQDAVERWDRMRAGRQYIELYERLHDENSSNQQ